MCFLLKFIYKFLLIIDFFSLILYVKYITIVIYKLKIGCILYFIIILDKVVYNMRKITSICISIIIIFTLSVSALANTNTPLTNYGESNPYETIINIDESGNPIIIKNNENDSEQQRRVAGVALVWSIKSIGNNTYELYCTATYTGDYLQAISINTVKIENNSSKKEYFNKKVYHVIPSSDRPLKKITFLASEFSVTDNAKEVRVTSEGVFALLMSNGWITLNDGIGVYTL